MHGSRVVGVEQQKVEYIVAESANNQNQNRLLYAMHAVTWQYFRVVDSVGTFRWKLIMP